MRGNLKPKGLVHTILFIKGGGKIHELYMKTYVVVLTDKRIIDYRFITESKHSDLDACHTSHGSPNMQSRVTYAVTYVE